MDFMFESVRVLRLEKFLSLANIAKELKCSKATASKYINLVESLISEKEKWELRSKIKSSAKVIKSNLTPYKNREADFDALKQRLEIALTNKISIAKSLKSYEVGYLGEFLVKYRLTRLGIEVFEPLFLKSACDLLIYGKGKYFRCEVKSTRNSFVDIHRTKFLIRGGYKDNPYLLSEKIDCFFCVDLIEENIFVIPAEFIFSCGEKRRVFSIYPTGSIWKFREDYSMFI